MALFAAGDVLSWLNAGQLPCLAAVRNGRPPVISRMGCR
jgi:hypothetical protein